MTYAKREGRLDGKVILVTGGARGQGAAHGRVFAFEGATVILTDVLDKDGEETSSRLRAEGLKVDYLNLDVADEASWRAAVSTVEERYGKIDGLVNNAGIFRRALLEEESLDSLLLTFKINAGGAFLGMKIVGDSMRRRGGGSIVNIASMNAHRVAPSSFSYNVSKAAILSMTQSGAANYSDDDIRVNSVSPGWLIAPMVNETSDPRAESDWRYGSRLSPLTLVKKEGVPRGAAPEEVSSAILYLLSDESSYVNGTDILVDGGALAW